MNLEDGYAPLREVVSVGGVGSPPPNQRPIEPLAPDGDYSSSDEGGEAIATPSNIAWRWPVIDPSTSTHLIDWDSFIVVLVIVVGVLAPFEAAFLDPKLDILFYVNRAIDFAFVVDMSLQFFIGYADPMRPASLIREPRLIARNYLTGWFAADFVSVLPMDAVCIWLDPEGADMAGTKGLETIRILRLVRLVRLARFKRLLHRWHTSFGLSFAEISLYKFFGTVVACCHWMACLWGGLAVRNETDHNWVSALQAAKGGPDDLYRGPFQVYTKSLYWAVITLTSIGYGDITPQNASEYWISIGCSAMMASLWAYVIAAVCGIVSTMEPHEMMYRRTMDDLNWMLTEHQVPHDMCKRLRRYFFETREISRRRAEKEVIDHMSPHLQGELAHFMHKKWIRKIWYLSTMPHELVVLLARRLDIAAYAPKESIFPSRTLYIIRRGICAFCGRILICGDLWGEDMIVSNEALRHRQPVRSLSYLSVLRLHVTDLMEITRNHPVPRAQLRWSQVQIALLRGMQRIKHALLETKAQDPVRYDKIMKEDRLEFFAKVLNGTFAPTEVPRQKRRRGSAQVELAEELSAFHRKSSMGRRVSTTGSTFANCGVERFAQLEDKVDELQAGMKKLLKHIAGEELTLSGRPTFNTRAAASGMLPMEDGDVVDFGELVPFFGCRHPNIYPSVDAEPSCELPTSGSRMGRRNVPTDMVQDERASTLSSLAKQSAR